MRTTIKKYQADIIFLLVVAFIVLSGFTTALVFAAAGSFSPSSVNFGNVAINGSADRQIVFTNTSPSPISGSVSAGPGFTCIGGGCSYNNLGIGSSITSTLRFNPTAAIAYTSDASFTSGGGTAACSATQAAPQTNWTIIGTQFCESDGACAGDGCFTTSGTYGGGTRVSNPLTGSCSTPGTVSTQECSGMGNWHTYRCE